MGLKSCLSFSIQKNSSLPYLQTEYLSTNICLQAHDAEQTAC